MKEFVLKHCNISMKYTVIEFNMDFISGFTFVIKEVMKFRCSNNFFYVK